MAGQVGSQAGQKIGYERKLADCVMYGVMSLHGHIKHAAGRQAIRTHAPCMPPT